MGTKGSTRTGVGLAHVGTVEKRSGVFGQHGQVQAARLAGKSIGRAGAPRAGDVSAVGAEVEPPAVVAPKSGQHVGAGQGRPAEDANLGAEVGNGEVWAKPVHEKARTERNYGPKRTGRVRVSPFGSAPDQHLPVAVDVQKTGHVIGRGTQVGARQARPGPTVAQHKTVGAGRCHRQNAGYPQRQVGAAGAAAHVHVAAGGHLHVVRPVGPGTAQVGRPAQGGEPRVQAGEYPFRVARRNGLRSVEHGVIRRVSAADHQHVASGGVERRAGGHRRN